MGEARCIGAHERGDRRSVAGCQQSELGDVGRLHDQCPGRDQANERRRRRAAAYHEHDGHSTVGVVGESLRPCIRTVHLHHERHAEQAFAAIPFRERERVHVLIDPIRAIRPALDRLEGEHRGEHASGLRDGALDFGVQVTAWWHLAREQLVARCDELREDADEPLYTLGVLGREEMRVGEQRAESLGVDPAGGEATKLPGDDLRVAVRASAMRREIAGHLVVCGRDGGSEAVAVVREGREHGGSTRVRWHTCRAPR